MSRIHTPKATNAWARQCSFPSAGYTSEKRGIWHDVKVGRDSAPMVGDRHLTKRSIVDCSGNVIPKRQSPHRSFMLAKIAVEQHMNTLTPAQRMAITPAQKWQLVEQLVGSSRKQGFK